MCVTNRWMSYKNRYIRRGYDIRKERVKALLVSFSLQPSPPSLSSPSGTMSAKLKRVCSELPALVVLQLCLLPETLRLYRSLA